MQISATSMQVLRECVDDRVPVIFSAEGWQIFYQTNLLAVKENTIVLQNRVPAAHISAVMTAKNFGLQCKMLRFTTPRLSSDGEHMIFELAELHQLEETRQAERFPFLSDESVICEIKNPIDQSTILAKSVLDMSATGISIRCARPSKLFQPGTKLPELRIIIDGDTYQKESGTVVYTRQLMDLNAKLRVQVGIKFS